MAEAVNHPEHYNKHPSGIECIDVVRHFNFNLGNVIKYLWRAPHKGATIEDLKKAAWYLQDEIAQMEKAQMVARKGVPKPPADDEED